jgi:hypothetical protein
LFRDAIKRLGRYKQLTCPDKIDLVERGNECAVHFNWLLSHEEEPALLVDVCFAWIMAIARRGTGRFIRPKRVEFQRPTARCMKNTFDARSNSKPPGHDRFWLDDSQG